MRLGHRGFGAVEAVADEPSEERVAHLAGQFKMLFAVLIYQKEMVVGLLCRDVDILA